MVRRIACSIFCTLLPLVFNLSFGFLSSAAGPTITWQRSQIKRMMIPTQTGAETITFKSDNDLSGVDVNIVPALKPYIQASPIHFDHILAGTSYALTLKISVPPSTQIGTIALHGCGPPPAQKIRRR